MSEIVSLDSLGPGQTAVIMKVGGNGRVRRRYMEMGFVKGEKVLVERVAPLGDPIEYLVKGYHLSLRKDDAAKITVQVCPSTCDCVNPRQCPHQQANQPRWRRWLSWLN